MSMMDVSPPFKQLLNSVSSKLSPDGVKILHEFCKDNGLLMKSQSEEISAADILSSLVDYGLVNQNNLQLLKFVVKESDQTDLFELLENFEETLPTSIDPLPSHFSHPSLNVSASGYTSANVIARREEIQIDRKSIQSLCMSLAEAAGVHFHYLFWLGYKERDENTLVLVAMLPRFCLSRLRTRLLEGEDIPLEILDIEEVIQRTEPDQPDCSGVFSRPVQELMRRIRNGEALSSNEIVSEIGPELSEVVINRLLSDAAQSSNAEAVHELHNLAASMELTTPGNSIIDELKTRGIAVGDNLLANAYCAGKEQIVRDLLDRGHVLRPTMVPYPTLLTTVCQIQNYPASLFESLLQQEDSIVLQFQDRTKGEVYEECLDYCCSNKRSDLLELLIRRYRRISVDKEGYSSCIGRAMSHIGSSYFSIQDRHKRTVKCVDVCWNNRGLLYVCDAWLIKANLGAFITKLDVSGNQLSSIPYNLLDGTLQLLEEVDCSGNKLKSLWSDDVPSPSTCKYRLRVLSVSNNELDEIPLHIFHIPSLEVLNVSSNALSELPSPAIRSKSMSTYDVSNSSESKQRCWLCRRLKELDASHNLIESLPEAFGDVLHLRKLIVANNNVKMLPRSLCKARFLEEVDLSCNNLGAADDVDFNLACLPKSVQRLRVSSNNLRKIPLSLATISSLRHLDCASNNISFLPHKQEWCLPHLEVLILSRNDLGRTEPEMELPESFSTTLTSLDISHNQLGKFPDAVLGLKQVVYLYLNGNPEIQRLPREIATLRRLCELEIDDLRKCMGDFDSALQKGTTLIRYNSVKQKIRDCFYGYDFFYGVQMTVVGSEASRDCVIRGLYRHAGRDLPDMQSVVSNLIMYSKQKLHPRRSRTRTITDVATFKLWNIPDMQSFIVLQHAFFAENTIHLLVWQESDGLSGLDGLYDNLLTMGTAAESVRVVLAVLATNQFPREIRLRLDKLAQTPRLHCVIEASVQRQGDVSLSPIPEKLFDIAVELSTVSDKPKGERNHWVPAVYREAAKKLFEQQTVITQAVCSRTFVRDHLLFGRLTDPDDFQQATTFLMRIGALLHFEDTTRDLHECFYANLDLVARVIVSLNAVCSRDISSGVAHSRHIYAVFSKLSVRETDGVALLTLLIKLGIVAPFDKCGCRYLLPFRLPCERNGLNLTLSRYLSPYDDSSLTSSPTYVRRLYSIEVLPLSFCRQLISALILQIRHSLCSLEQLDGQQEKVNSVFWANGIVTLYGDGCFIVHVVTTDDSTSDHINVIESTRQCINSGIDVVVFDRNRRFAALGWISRQIERLLGEWIIKCGGDPSSHLSSEGSILSVERLVPYPAFDVNCSHSRDEALNDFIFEHVIPEKASLLKVEDCAESIIRNSMKMSTSDGQTVDVSHFVPDLALFIVLFVPFVLLFPERIRSICAGALGGFRQSR